MSEENIYRLAALVVLAMFYGIYFAKLLVQKNRGIKTHQIGSRKEKGIHTTEMFMSAATFGIVVVQLFSVAFGKNYMPANVRIIGFFIGMAGDTVFLVSVLCMKDSWRAGIPAGDKTELVTDGIYKFSRNPAFLGFDLQYIGMLILYFNIPTVIFSAFAILMLHFQILQEEKYLSKIFGSAYDEYKKHVMRYIGRR